MDEEACERLREDERRMTVAQAIARRVWDDRDMVAEKAWKDRSAQEAIAQIVYMTLRETAGLEIAKSPLTRQKNP